MVCRLPFQVRISKRKMDFLPSFRLGIRVFVQCVLGGYPISQILVFSTLSTPLEKMYNQSVYDHYGLLLDKRQFAYVVGLISAAKIIGSIFSMMYLYPMVDKLGRKKMAVYAPFILGGLFGSVCQICSKLLNSVEFFFFGELFIGAAFPIMNYANIIYLSECAPSRIRGATTLILSSAGVISWTLMSFLCKPGWFGTEENWHFVPFTIAMMAIAHFLICVVYPESPKHLLRKEKRTEAAQSIRLFHGPSADVDEALEECFREVSHPLDESVTLWSVWQDTQYREAFLCVFLFDISQNLSPQILDVNFNVVIKKKFGFSIDEIMNQRIITSFIFFPMHFIGAFVVERLGRRFVMWAGASLALSMALCLSFGDFMADHGQVGFWTIGAGWTVTVLGNLLSNCGYGNMALLMVSELCVPSIRTTVAQASALLCMVCQMILLGTYPPLEAIFGGWYYIPMIIYIVVVFYFLSGKLPETRRMSVDKIISTMEEQVRSRTNTAVSRRQTLSERDPLIERRRSSGDVY